MRNPILLVLCLILLIGSGCREKKRYHDQSKQEITSSSAALQEILEHRKEQDDFFRDPEDSPLPDRYRKNFAGLDYFEPDTALRVVATLTRTPEALPFNMPTTTDRLSVERVYGILHFDIEGTPFQLEIYQSPELLMEEGFEDYLFLSFTDLTNGEETYGGGRYLDLSIPDGDTLIIDFNKAYNPYCVYNKKYSCPLVPSANDLPVRIAAGVKMFRP